MLCTIGHWTDYGMGGWCIVKHQSKYARMRLTQTLMAKRQRNKHLMSEEATSNAADVKPAVENKSMSDKDFLSSRIAKLSAKAPQAEAKKPETAPVEQAPVAESPSQEGEPKPKEPDPKEVLSKDVDELTDEEIAELAQRGKSGLLKRIAELTAKRKLAEEKAAALEATMRQQPQEPKVENNPYASITDTDQLLKKKQEVDESIEWAEDVLFRAEDLAADDVAISVDGKDYTKAFVRDYLKNARKARDKYLPAQEKELVARDQRNQLEIAFRQQARNELSWLAGEDNDTRKRYEAMVGDPRLKKLKESVPEIAPQIEYLIAHAANSMYGRRVIEMDKPKSPAINPPASPNSAAAAPERTESRAEKSIRDIESRFKQTGNSSDFIALRAAQISKRKS